MINNAMRATLVGGMINNVMRTGKLLEWKKTMNKN